MTLKLIGARVLSLNGPGEGEGPRVVAEYRLDPATGTAVPVVGRDTMLHWQAEQTGVPIHGGLVLDRRVAELIEQEFGPGVVEPAYYRPASGRKFLLALLVDFGVGGMVYASPIFEGDWAKGGAR